MIVLSFAESAVNTIASASNRLFKRPDLVVFGTIFFGYISQSEKRGNWRIQGAAVSGRGKELAKIIAWHPNLCSKCPLLWEILDPLLSVFLSAIIWKQKMFVIWPFVRAGKNKYKTHIYIYAELTLNTLRASIDRNISQPWSVHDTFKPSNKAKRELALHYEVITHNTLCFNFWDPWTYGTHINAFVFHNATLELPHTILLKEYWFLIALREWTVQRLWTFTTRINRWL